MSSSKRLKRKLEDLGVDLSSGKANENFCLIGTPLPPLEKSKKDAGEFVPLWKQEVRDEKGRRRLHGAFTGGFSAGYFNTVGSKEGWTPSTFVSSRSDRAKQKAARPEDFMDEEDLQDLKDSRTIIDTADEMDLTGASGQPSVEDKESDSLAAALEASMLPPPSDSAGARILKKMGWRLGQGIGPRLTFQQRKVQDAELGAPAPQKDEEDAEAEKHLYPRRDTKVMLFDRKDNSWGLGYSPGMGLNESVGLSGQSKKSEPKGPRLAAGFGLGALNDADDDDVDVYDPITGHTNHRRREAYDFAHEQEDDGMDRITKGSRYMRQTSSSTNHPMVPQFFRDGQPVLQGFSLSNKAVMEDRWFPLPEVPKGWMPDPKRVWEKKDDASKKENKENVPQVGQGVKSAWDAKMSADERGQMLGETPLPAAPRSVFDFMSKKDRERLESIKSNLSAGQAKVPPTPYTEDDSSPGPLPYTMPRTEPHIAQAALRGFRPFAADPAKQARYEIYLESQLLPTDGGAPKPELKALPTQKADEFRKEVEDYAKAALLFKPMSGAMAGRFQSAGVVEMAKPEEGFRSGSAEGEKGQDGEVQANKKAPAPATEREDPKAHAAKMGMYGGLTRETSLWIPARLLCKRFGVKDPEVSLPEEMGAPGPSSSVNTPSWQTGQTEFTSNFGTSAGSGTGASQANAPDDEASGNKKNGRRDLANVGLGEDDDQGRDTLTYERPSIEVFKAIFASDDEDDDDEDEKEEVLEPSLAAPTGESGPVVSQPILPNQNEPVDLSTFKPTFIPRGGKDKEKDAEKLAKKEKKKKDKKTKAVLSFEMDEDGGGLEVKPERPKKKKKKDKSEGDVEKEKGPSKPTTVEEDDEMWVEKPVADAVKDLPPVSAPAAPERRDGEMMEVEGSKNGGSGPRGRKRAIDFL